MKRRKLSRPVEKKPNNNKLVKKKLFNYKLKLKYSPLEQKICNFCRLGKSSVGTQESYKISRIKLL